jgi:hypothetical protein
LPGWKTFRIKRLLHFVCSAWSNPSSQDALRFCLKHVCLAIPYQKNAASDTSTVQTSSGLSLYRPCPGSSKRRTTSYMASSTQMVRPLVRCEREGSRVRSPNRNGGVRHKGQDLCYIASQVRSHCNLLINLLFQLLVNLLFNLLRTFCIISALLLAVSRRLPGRLSVWRQAFVTALWTETALSYDSIVRRLRSLKRPQHSTPGFRNVPSFVPQDQTSQTAAF